MNKLPIKQSTEFSTIIELLSWRAINQPEKRAYTFLIEGETEEAHLTYAELARKARNIAGLLQKHKATGERVLLLYPSELDFITAFFGCLYGGVIAIPAYPPHPNRLKQTLSWLRAIASNAQPLIGLTTTSILATFESLFAQDQYLKSIHLLSTDNLSDNQENESQDIVVNSNNLAFLQYTSGSTATPKGVMVNHSNLMDNQKVIQMTLQHTEQSTIASWMPLYHSAGLGVALQALYTGSLCILMSSEAFLQKPFRWLHTISRYKVITTGGPNFAYKLCLQEITAEQMNFLDLSSWSIAFNASEPICAETLKKFATVFEPCGFRRQVFYPSYGITESTLFAAGGLKGSLPIVCTFDKTELEKNRVLEADGKQDKIQTLVSCGQTLPGQTILIVNPESLSKCISNEVGEIWISGPSIAQGYWNRHEETESTFRAYLANNGEGPFLRTGDLGFFKDGKLFITGRLKDVIIIRGRNYYPQDIELTVTKSHSALRAKCNAAFSVEIAGEERLVVFQELNTNHQNLDVNEVVETIRKAIGEYYEQQAYAILLLMVESIPKTSSGKIQRHVCRTNFIDGNLDDVIWSSILDDSYHIRNPKKTLVAPQSEFELQLTKIWEKVLGIQPIGVKDNFFALGGHSLLAARLLAAIEEEFGKKLPLTTLFQAPTVEQLTKIFHNQEWKSSWYSLVPVQPSGSRPPLFGISHNFRDLSHYLGQEQPVYRLHYGIGETTDKEISLPTLENLAAHYIQEMRSLQPEGPYYLMGLSFGGVVAYEMAQQLVGQGQQVAFLGLFDTFIERQRTFLPLHQRFSKLFQLTPSELLRRIKTKIKGKLVKHDNKYLPHVYNFNLVIRRLEAYTPQVYSGRVTLFKAMNQISVNYAITPPEVGWRKFVNGELEIHEIPGSHTGITGILEEPNVKILAEKMRACIEKSLNNE